MLRTMEGLLAVWRQQPENHVALQRYLAELQSKVEAVRTAAGAAPPAARETPKPPPNATDRSTSGPPSGPVKSSSRPSPLDEVQQRIKATERFLPAGPRPGEPSLAGISSQQIRAACDLAQSQIARLSKLLQSVPADRPAVDRSLKELNESLHHFHGPVEIPEPTAPRPNPVVKPRS
jgi:hypothetical protein